MKMTEVSTSMWSLTFQGSLTTHQISQTKVDEEIVEQHIDVVDQTVRLLRTLRDSSSNINAYDKETLDNLSPRRCCPKTFQVCW